MSESIDFQALKQNIDLTQYAAYLGYKMNKKKSTKRSVVMCLDHADKIIISKRNGIWVYFSFYDDQDNGSIIDFVKNRNDCSIYEAGKILEKWSGSGSSLLNQDDTYLKEDCPDPQRVQRLYRHYQPARYNGYLQSRGIGGEVLCSQRFTGRIYQDQYRNAVFPHYKKGMISGLALRGEEVNLMVRGSEKTLWRSNYLIHDTKLIITETPIDAISYQILHKLKDGFYTATCGAVSEKQLNIVRRLVSKTSWIEQVILAMDNDPGGDHISKRLEDAVHGTIFSGALIRHSPETRGSDWNDVLTAL